MARDHLHGRAACITRLVEQCSGRWMFPVTGERRTSMRSIGLAVLVPWCITAVCITAVAGAQEKTRDFRFSKNDLGKVPAGWTAERTGKGEGSVWKVVEDKTSPSKSGVALAQTAVGPSSLFNLCVAEDTHYKDVEVIVAFKANHGKKDQGGGIVWRYQDANNYYIARMNPLEDNYRLYKVIGGERMQLETKEDIKIPVGEWHHLKIKHVGDMIECYLDGKRILQHNDNTIAQPGKIGLWSKADAQTYFDNFAVIEAKN